MSTREGYAKVLAQLREKIDREIAEHLCVFAAWLSTHSNELTGGALTSREARETLVERFMKELREQ